MTTTDRIDRREQAMQGPADTGARATDPAVRERWNRVLGFLKDQATSADPAPFARELVDQARSLEKAVYPSQREILATTLLWNEGEHEFVQWVHGAYHRLGRAAAKALGRADLEAPVPGGATGTLAALALAAFGNAIKWAGIAEAERDPVSLVEVKRVHALVERAGIGRESRPLPHGERDAMPGIDALFIRALLLDAICRGNLGPRQVEIIDGWLWEWSGDYALTDRVDGAVLAFEETGERGLRTTHGAASTPGGRRYISIGPLERHIATVVRGFREGVIFPGYGCAAEFRVEEHTAALDFLRFFFEATRNHVARQARHRREERVEAFAGMAEVLAKAFAPRLATAPTHRLPNPRLASQQAPGIDRLFEIPRRMMRLVDESPDGLGVEYEEDAMKPVEVGMLLAVHRDDDVRPALCEVMRRSPGNGRRVRLGLRILSREPVKLFLAQPGTDGGLNAIYLPGKEASGHLDTLLVAEQDFRYRERYEVAFDDRSFTLRLNRVRYHGRGWYLAAFEVDEERKRCGA